MWQLDHKEGWVPKNWCFRIMVLEKTLESPLDSKEIEPVNPKGNQPWVFIGRNDAETETPVFGYLVRRTNSLEKTLILRKTEGRRRGRQRVRWLNSITDSMDMSLSKLRKTVTGKSGVLQFVGLQRVRYNLTSEQQDDQSLHTYQCMTRNYIICIYVCVCVCVYIYIYIYTDIYM